MSVTKLITGRADMSFNPVGDLAAQVNQIAATRSLNDEKIGTLAISSESIDSADGQMLLNVATNMESMIKTIVSDFNLSVESHNIEAATMGGVFASNPRAVLASKLKPSRTDAVSIVANVVDGSVDRPMAFEAYDERENRNAQMYSIVYNLLASRQDEFGETLFPTININPAEVGILISVKMFYVYNDFKRTVTGALADYGRMSVIRAYANSDILKNELTRALPVLRSGGGADDNSDKFAPASEVPSWTVNLGTSVTVPTSAVKVDARIDMLGISQTNELLNSGMMGPSDALDSFVKLDAIYLKVTDGTNTDVIRIPVDHLPGSTYTYAPQGNSRRMVLSLDTDGVVLDSSAVKAAGGALEVLTELATHKARIHVNLNGSVVLDKAEGIASRGNVALAALRNNAGQLVTGAAFASLAAKLASAEIAYYTYTAYRANSNIRQRGQLLDSQVEYRVVQVPYRSPVAIIAPTMSVSSDDTSGLQTLITTTGIRISNEAVTSLLKAASSMEGYKSVALANGELPELNDIGHYYVKPTYFSEAVNLELTVDSRASHEKIKDIRAALVEKIRFYANEMYRTSEYQAAAMVLTGNIGFKPTVIVATDSVIANYLAADGDLRTLGESFDVKIVSSLDRRVAGKIFLTFGVFDSTRNSAINPLNSGNMLYASELVTKLPISRDGQVSDELIVTPRFYHMWNLPVMTKLTVTGLPEVTGKIAVNFNQV